MYKTEKREALLAEGRGGGRTSPPPDITSFKTVPPSGCGSPPPQELSASLSVRPTLRNEGPGAHGAVEGLWKIIRLVNGRAQARIHSEIFTMSGSLPICPMGLKPSGYIPNFVLTLHPIYRSIYLSIYHLSI